DGAAGAELGAAEDVAASDDHRQLHAAVVDALGLLGDVDGFVDADAALAGRTEALAAELEHHAGVAGFERFWGMVIVHRWSRLERVIAPLILASTRKIANNDGLSHTASTRSRATISQVPTTRPPSTTYACLCIAHVGHTCV